MRKKQAAKVWGSLVYIPKYGGQVRCIVKEQDQNHATWALGRVPEIGRPSLHTFRKWWAVTGVPRELDLLQFMPRGTVAVYLKDTDTWKILTTPWPGWVEE